MSNDFLGNRSGIYRITCATNGRFYIGSAVNLGGRRADHTHRLRCGKHENGRLQGAWDKYGEAAFQWEVVEFVPDVSMLIEREQFWIDSTGATSREFGFNIAPVAGSQYGYRHTEDAKCKIRLAHTGRKVSEPTRNKMRAAAKARCTPEWRENLSQKTKGRIITDEVRAKLAEANRGKKASDEARAKMSEKRKGVTMPSAQRITIGDQTKTFKEWALISGVDRKVIEGRWKRGWQAQDAVFTTPVLGRNQSGLPRRAN